MTIKEKKNVLQQYQLLHKHVNKTKASFVAEGYGTSCADEYQSCMFPIRKWITHGEYALEDMKQELESVFCTIKDSTLQNLFRYRYLERMKWDDIAEKLSYDRRWVLRLHDKALERLSFETLTQKNKAGFRL